MTWGICKGFPVFSISGNATSTHGFVEPDLKHSIVTARIFALDYFREDGNVALHDIGTLRDRWPSLTTKIESIFERASPDHSDNKLVPIEGVKDHAIKISGSFTQHLKAIEHSALVADKKCPHELTRSDALGCPVLSADGLSLLKSEIAEKSPSSQNSRPALKPSCLSK